MHVVDAMCTMIFPRTLHQGVVPALLIGVYFVTFGEASRGRTAKRIAEGGVLTSQDQFATQHFIQLRRAWSCISPQAEHQPHGCTETLHCGGSLLHPEFVLTAAHCVTYHEFYLRETDEIYNVSQIVENAKLTPEQQAFLGLVELRAQVVNSLQKVDHPFYSNVVLMAGSTDYFHMNQRRHGLKVFIHPNFNTSETGRFNLLNQDVAIIQVCQPFDITESVKTTPMLPLTELTKHFDSVVRRSAACLFVGFGDTEDFYEWAIALREDYIIPTRHMRFTWRQLACGTKCNYNSSKEWGKSVPWDKPRNPCLLCSDPILPRLGTPVSGDSGGPVICDSYYIGLFIAYLYNNWHNITQAWVYPVQCIRNDITPEQLEFYKVIPPGDKEFHTLDHVKRRFRAIRKVQF